MNRYWDMPEQERAELTTAQVEAFLSVELMEKGVASVEPPVLHEIVEVTVPESQYFEVTYAGDSSYSRDESTGFVFETYEQAQSFIDASPFKLDENWSMGGHKYAKHLAGYAIKPVDLANEQDTLNHKVALEKARELKSANESARNQFATDRKAVDDAVGGVWDDWRECTSAAAAHQQAYDTFAEYIQLCDGDSSKALIFLHKALSDEQIADACKWDETGRLAVTVDTTPNLTALKP